MAKSKKSGKKKRGNEKAQKVVPPWTEEKLSRIKAFLEKDNPGDLTSKDRKAALMSIQYRMEYYLLTSSAEISKIKPIAEFLADYLKLLKIPFKLFALSIDTTDANLKKYLNGKRKFSTDLALKFGAFFQMPPELWLNIQAKNDIIRAETNPAKDYSGYNYQNLVPA